MGRRFKPDLGHYQPQLGAAPAAPDGQVGHGLVDGAGLGLCLVVLLILNMVDCEVVERRTV